MTNTKTFNLIELKDRFDSKQIKILTSQKHEITLDNKHDISLIQLLTHNGKEYFGFLNEATNLDKSFWVVDDETHYVTISALELELELEEETETSVEETSVEETSVEETSVEETSVDINAVVELCSEFSGIELLELCQKLQPMALKKIKTENKKTTKKSKEKTQATSNKRVSDKNFNYFTLLCNWYNSALSAREIAADTELSNGYGPATIAEDMRVIKILLGGDKLVQISKEWRDYIINYWSENSDTTWQRLHYAFAKEGRKCNDLDILCNYVIDNGVTKDDVKNAIAASQN